MTTQRSLTREILIGKMLSKAGAAELIGLEVENGLVDPETGRSVAYRGEHGSLTLLDALISILGGIPICDGPQVVGAELPTGARFTLETGGALEYASVPSLALSTAVDVATRDLQQAAVIADQAGIALLSGACLPFTARNDIPWTPKPRVKVMRDYFGLLGESGKHADAVMGLTLSTQTSLDYLSEEDFIEKLRLQVLAAPIITSLFVNSPIGDGADSGVMSRRMQYWMKFDPRRCGVLDFALNSKTQIADVIDWAIKLPMIYRNAGGSHVAAPDRTFAELMRSGFGDGTWPTYEDWELHLCQLWPHVRVRGTLELRASDGLPWPYFSASPAIWVGLCYNAKIRKAALAVLSDITSPQLECAVNDIAIKGLAASVGPYNIQELTRELLRLAKLGLQARVQAGIDPEKILTYLDPLEDVCESGHTFADKCLENWHGELRQTPKKYVEKYRIPVRSH